MALHWKCDRCGGWHDAAVTNPPLSVTGGTYSMVQPSPPKGWISLGSSHVICEMCATAFERWMKEKAS